MLAGNAQQIGASPRIDDGGLLGQIGPIPTRQVRWLLDQRLNAFLLGGKAPGVELEEVDRRSDILRLDPSGLRSGVVQILDHLRPDDCREQPKDGEHHQQLEERETRFPLCEVVEAQNRRHDRGDDARNRRTKNDRDQRREDADQGLDAGTDVAIEHVGETGKHHPELGRLLARAQKADGQPRQGTGGGERRSEAAPFLNPVRDPTDSGPEHLVRDRAARKNQRGRQRHLAIDQRPERAGETRRIDAPNELAEQRKRQNEAIASQAHDRLTHCHGGTSAEQPHGQEQRKPIMAQQSAGGHDDDGGGR
ncbi:hypothetical protein BHE90_017747 [Fusarium euwallaceae]|uniref:Uncharacterized protein n=1 Tax=Fusarium euwallaceae TaxID=1147111 RepID=A0A430KWM5_9HYPO|nr:hypothetical protein BHE90_017747 [Fusarium euwallaceae]